jgi:hypothetical protein
MAREWEVPYVAKALDYVDNPWIKKYNDTRYKLDQRRFYPDRLEGFDSRSGTKRKYMDANKLKYLREELRLRNRDGLTGWR